MRRFFYFTVVLSGLVFYGHAQDEGSIAKRERIARDNGIFLAIGPSFTLGKNIGDYKTGFNFELGYLKRLNRVLSIGPSLSYLQFEYDPEVTSLNGGDAYLGLGDPNEWGLKYGLSNFDYYYGYVLTLKGGNLSLTSLAMNMKFNIIPIMGNTKISVYGFAKPFITFAERSEVTGSDVRYTFETFEDNNGTSTPNDDFLYYNLGDGEFYPDGFTSTWGPEDYPALASGSEVTGGLFIGPGIEVFPNSAVSFFLQASFGYTFPITFVSTSSYDATVDSYIDADFPMIKKGFPSVNIQVGLSFNF